MFAMDLPEALRPEFLAGCRPEVLVQGIVAAAKLLESLPRESYFEMLARGVVRAEELQGVRFTFVGEVRNVPALSPR